MDPNRPDRMPVLVLSGFLGAGKTTFLNQLLATPALADSLVIVNEFGDAGLDSLFLEAESQDQGSGQGSGLMVEELTSGCLCCTLQGPLVTTLEDLLRARDNGRIKPFKQLIIETTGLADPAPILGAFAKHPYLSLRYLVGGIVTVVDAANAQAVGPWSGAGAEMKEAKAQIAVADMLAISKTDLADEKSLSQLQAALSMRNPHAKRETTARLADDTQWLETLLAQASPITPSPIMPSPIEPMADTAPAHDLSSHHSHDHHHDHDHDHQHAYSVVVETNTPLESRVLTMFMDLLGMNLPGELLRVKGIVWIDGSEGAEPWAVHAAGPLQHPARPITGPIVDKLSPYRSQIVVITRTDQTKRVNDLFKACLKQNQASKTGLTPA